MLRAAVGRCFWSLLCCDTCKAARDLGRPSGVARACRGPPPPHLTSARPSTTHTTQLPFSCAGEGHHGCASAGPAHQALCEARGGEKAPQRGVGLWAMRVARWVMCEGGWVGRGWRGRRVLHARRSGAERRVQQPARKKLDDVEPCSAAAALPGKRLFSTHVQCRMECSIPLALSPLAARRWARWCGTCAQMMRQPSLGHAFPLTVAGRRGDAAG